MKKELYKKRRPSSQHHVRSNDELNTGDILNGEIVTETNETDDNANQKTEKPFHENILKNLDIATCPPVLFEEIILCNPSKKKTSNPLKNSEKKKEENFVKGWLTRSRGFR